MELFTAVGRDLTYAFLGSTSDLPLQQNYFVASVILGNKDASNMPKNLSTFPRSSRSLVHFSAICDWAGNAIAALIAPRMIFRYENLCHIVLSYQNVNSFVYIRHTTQFSLTLVLPGVVQVGTSPLYAHGRWAGAVEPRGLVRPGREAPKPAKKGHRSC